MKQTFTIEIDSSYYVKPISAEFLGVALNEGFYECAMPNLNICSIKETTVEQSVEPLKNQEVVLNLLKRAADSLHEYCRYTHGPSCDSLGEEIDKYIGKNTRER